MTEALKQGADSVERGGMGMGSTLLLASEGVWAQTRQVYNPSCRQLSPSITSLHQRETIFIPKSTKLCSHT
jgi:hypothetical protein